MRIDIPNVTPEVLEAVANVYRVAAGEMRRDTGETIQAENRRVTDVQSGEVVTIDQFNEPVEAVEDVAAEDSHEETDARGVMHDPEIHARTKSKDAAGNWKKKRGLSDEHVAAAERKPGEEPVQAVGEDIETVLDNAPETTEPLPTNVGEFVRWCSDNNVDTPQVQTVLAAKGVSGIVALDGNPELVAEVCAELLA